MQSDYSELVDQLSGYAMREQLRSVVRLAMIEAATAITTLQAELAEARQANDTALAMAMQAGADAERVRIVDWLNSQPETLHHDDIANAIEARDWNKK